MTLPIALAAAVLVRQTEYPFKPDMDNSMPVRYCCFPHGSPVWTSEMTPMAQGSSAPFRAVAAVVHPATPAARQPARNERREYPAVEHVSIIVWFPFASCRFVIRSTRRILPFRPGRRNAKRLWSILSPGNLNGGKTASAHRQNRVRPPAKCRPPVARIPDPGQTPVRPGSQHPLARVKPSGAFALPLSRFTLQRHFSGHLLPTSSTRVAVCVDCFCSLFFC